MYRIDNATAVAALPTPAAVGPNPDSYFTKGDPGSGIPATIVDDDWANAVQEEICNVIEAAGIVLNKTDRTQLYDAVVAIIAASATSVPDASTTVKGIVELATDAETQTGTDSARAITPANLTARTATETRTGIVELATDAEAQAFTALKFIDGAKLATALKGSNQSLATSGYQKFPGGLIMQWGVGAFSTGGSAVTFPVAFPNSCVRVFGFDDSSTVPRQFSANNKTTTGFNFYVNTGSSGNAGYWAIGY